MDYFSLLPVEVNELVRNYLSLEDIRALTQVSRLQHLYTKNFVGNNNNNNNSYSGTIYTGYAICLYSDPVMAPIAKLLPPLLNFPLETRYYKVTVTGRLACSGKLAGKIKIIMSELQSAPYDDNVSDWPDDDTIAEIHNQFGRDNNLYFDHWLSCFGSDINRAMYYDIHNSCGSFSQRQYRAKQASDDIWQRLEVAEINTDKEIKVELWACYNSISPIIYIDNPNDRCSVIKLITDCQQFITTVIFHYEFAVYDNSIHVCTYSNNNYTSDLQYQYQERVLSRLNYCDSEGDVEYRWHDHNYSVGVWASRFPKVGHSYPIPVDSEIKRRFSLDDDNPWYVDCYSLRLPALIAGGESKEFVLPKLL